MPRPVWLLDVDGVLNADVPGWGGEPVRRQVWSSHLGRELTIYWAPGLIEGIHRLGRAGDVEIRWCTTWCGDTAVLEQTFALPRFGSSWTGYCDGVPAKEAKLAAARAVLAAGRRLIWTDDSEVPGEGTDLYRELTGKGTALLIRPDARHGLQPDDMAAIETFIRRSLAERNL